MTYFTLDKICQAKLLTFAVVRVYLTPTLWFFVDSVRYDVQRRGFFIAVQSSDLFPHIL